MNLSAAKALGLSIPRDFLLVADEVIDQVLRNDPDFAGAAVWPLAARAQGSAVPVVGVLGIGLLEADAPSMIGLRKGLRESGFVEGREDARDRRLVQRRRPTSIVC